MEQLRNPMPTLHTLMKTVLQVVVVIGTWAAFCVHSALPSKPPLRAVSISLEDAIKRAQLANSAFAQATSDAKIAQSERSIARSRCSPTSSTTTNFCTRKEAAGRRPPPSNSLPTTPFMSTLARDR